MFKMSTVYTNSGADESAVDIDLLAAKARGLVSHVMRHMGMDAGERQIFREDMLQEALTLFYQNLCVKGYEEAYAYAAARTDLIGYVFVNIRGGGSGHQWELSKQYRIYDNLTEPEYIDEDGRGERTIRLPAALYKQRPVEEAVEAREGETEEAEQWLAFEREIARILAVMRGRQWHPNSLRRAATALCESAKGTSNYNIARLLKLDWLAATSLILHYRPYLEAFLAMPPLLQGLVRAEGELRLCWWDEVTAEALNGGQKFIVILPIGAFTVCYHHDRRRETNASAGSRWAGGSTARWSIARCSWAKWAGLRRSACGMVPSGCRARWWLWMGSRPRRP
jgi:hypothetical protein